MRKYPGPQSGVGEPMNDEYSDLVLYVSYPTLPPCAKGKQSRNERQGVGRPKTSHVETFSEDLAGDVGMSRATYKRRRGEQWWGGGQSALRCRGSLSPPATTA
jgi:hypothetical protein